MIEFYKEQEKQEKNNFDSKNRQYGDDLAKQIEYKTVNKQIVSLAQKCKLNSIFRYIH